MKTITFLISLTLISMISFGQYKWDKTKELSITGSYQNYSSGNSSGSTSAFLISPRLGFFVLDGLELEPELLCMLSSGSDPIYVINGLVSYNFISDRRSIPFILLGYGIANTVPFFNVPMLSTNFRVNVLNLGFGLKTRLSDDIRLRIEYRYQKYSGSGSVNPYSGYYYTQTTDTRINSIQFGLSYLY